MDNVLLQLGVGGIFAYIIIKEVLLFLSKKRPSNGNNGHSGEKSVDYWKAEISAAMTFVLATQSIPILNEIKAAQKDNVELLRSRIHGVNNNLTRIVLLLELLRAETAKLQIKP